MAFAIVGIVLAIFWAKHNVGSPSNIALTVVSALAFAAGYFFFGYFVAGMLGMSYLRDLTVWLFGKRPAEESDEVTKVVKDELGAIARPFARVFKNRRAARSPRVWEAENDLDSIDVLSSVGIAASILAVVGIFGFLALLAVRVQYAGMTNR